MIIIGGKKIKLNINEIIDSIKKNVRCNLSLPHGTNGTKVEIIYLNNHVFRNYYINKKSVRELSNLYKTISEEHIKKLVEIIKDKRYSSVVEMMETGNIKTNKILTSLGCRKITGQLRCGYQAIIDYIEKGEKEIFVYGFSLSEKDNKTFYNSKDIQSCHIPSQEFLLLKELHNKRRIDITLCLLEDSYKPILDCSAIVPSIKCIRLLLTHFQEIGLRNTDGVFLGDNFVKIKKEDLLIIKQCPPIC